MTLNWSFLKQMTTAEYTWVVVCGIYMMADIPMPLFIAEKIDTPLGKLALVLGALSLFTHPNPLIGLLGMMVAYTVMRRAVLATGSGPLFEYALSEETKWKSFPKRHEFPYTLEEEMVKKYAKVKFNTDYEMASYRPVMDNLHNAAFIKDTM